MKKSVADIVTERIIEELEKGKIPWQKPWNGGDPAISHSTGKRYSSLNQMLLGQTGEYLTFAEVVKEGGKVKKDEKGNFVVSWIIKDVKTGMVDEETGEDILKRTFAMRYYYVFEVSQCEGINRKYTEEAKTYEHNANEEAEKIIKDYVKREEGFSFYETDSEGAYYNPIDDFVVVPKRTQFEHIEEFYSTAFHEIGHSTMKSNRCNREAERTNKNVAFGSQEYSKEELVAEITAASLVNHTGLETEKSFRNSAAYIQSWVKALKNDPKMIISASAKADKAFNYILGTEN